MRISISNISWETQEDEAMVEVLKEFKVDAIDIAPGKYFPATMDPSKEELRKVREFWNSRGIELVGMQSLLFGTSGLNLFGDKPTRDRMLEHLGKVCIIAEGLGIDKLVFGSPKNRDRSGLSEPDVLTIATDFFTQMGELAKQNKVTICLEPNPVNYGCNFMTHSTEAAKIVSLLNHPNVKMQLDTGTIITNKENFESEYQVYKGFIGHFHASEPNLVPVGANPTWHREIATVINKDFSNRVLTIEMLTSKERKDLSVIRDAIQFTCETYR